MKTTILLIIMPLAALLTSCGTSGYTGSPSSYTGSGNSLVGETLMRSAARMQANHNARMWSQISAMR